jgi:NAD(P)-dependent dehydrogenase (short-subunit alcohol dehydrogenase family)
VDEIGDNAHLVILDVTDGESVANAAREVGDLDVLVNNAGISIDVVPVTEADVDAFRRTFETNVFGVVAVTGAFLPALRRSERPRIVNISSGTGSLGWSSGPEPHFPTTGALAAYRSSKTALNAVTVFYAQALASDGFKVNALAPGLRKTNLNATAAASGGDPAEAAAGAVRLALLPDDGPTGEFLSWDGPACRGDHRCSAGRLREAARQVVVREVLPYFADEPANGRVGVDQQEFDAEHLGEVYQLLGADRSRQNGVVRAARG